MFGWINRLLCKVFGHDYEEVYIIGIRADMKKVNRVIFSCKREGCNMGDSRIQLDSIMEEADSKEGYYSWGSAGPCYGCANKEDCPDVPWKRKDMCMGAFAWAKCPISNFKIIEGMEHFLTGDRIIYQTKRDDK